MKPQACIQQVHTILGMCSTHATCCTIYLQHCEMIQCSTGSQVDHAYSRCTPSAFFISHLQHICHMLCNLMYNMAQCIICFQAWTILPPTHPPPPNKYHLLKFAHKICCLLHFAGCYANLFVYHSSLLIMHGCLLHVFTSIVMFNTTHFCLLHKLVY